MIDQPNGRRRRVVRVSHAALIEIFTESPRPQLLACTHGLPRGARFIGHEYAAESDTHFLVFECDTWPLVPFGERLPEHEIRFTRYEPQEFV